MFSGFSFYDDEGSLILMSRWLMDGHSVYGEFNSIYGPFYFLYVWTAHTLLGGSASHTTARLIAVVPWVLTCVVTLGYTLRMTRSRAAALVAWIVVLRALTFFALEPGHPQEISMLLVVALLAAGIRPNPSNLIAAGALVAALFLTKINLGVFAGAALLLVSVSSLPAGRARNVLIGVMGGICVAAPAVLMRPLLGTGWVQVCCTLLTLSIAPMVAVLAAGKPEGIPARRQWPPLALGFAVCAALVIGWSMSRGASLYAMAQSTVLANLTQSHSWTIPLELGIAGILSGVAGATVAAVWLYGVRGRAFEWLRLAVGAAALLAILANQPHIAFAVALPFLWMVLLPGVQTTPLWPRCILAAITVMEAMSVYPVAGSQLRFTTVLLAIAATQMVYDSWTVLGRAAIWSGESMRRAEKAAIAVVLAAYIWSAGRALTNYLHLAPLDLNGTSGVHIDAADRNTYHWIVSHARGSCDSLVSFPAMHSVYFWTGMVPPVYPDVDGWQAYTNAGRQSIERRILSSPRACVLIVDKLMDFWLPPGDENKVTLLAFIRENFTEAYGRDGFHFLVRKH